MSMMWLRAGDDDDDDDDCNVIVYLSYLIPSLKGSRYQLSAIQRFK